MKNYFTLLVLLITAIAGHSQITIQATDIPLPGIFNLKALALPINSTRGSNQTWDFSTSTPSGSTSNVYTSESLIQWTSQGVDVYTKGFKNLNSTFGYNYWSEIDKATTGMVERGMNVPQQGYDLSAITGSVSDSLLIPEQDVFYTLPKTLMPFPMTSTYNNTYVSGRNVVNFVLNVPAFGLNSTPCQQAFYEVRKDSVIGWGTLRVYTPSGASAPYDVLMCKTQSFTTDSFYVGGAPATTAIQTAFQISQGQRSTIRNSYNFYRKGYFNYLLRLYYGQDSTFTTMTDAYSHADDVAPTATNDIQKNSYQGIVYPNPSRSDEVNVRVIGKVISKATFIMADMQGKVMQQESIVSENGVLSCHLNSLIPNGTYTLRILDEKGILIISELISLKR